MKLSLKERISAGDTLIGTLITLKSADVVDVLSRLGFDYLWIDGEHSVLDMAAVQSMVQAAGERCPCLVRIPESREIWVKKALDTGCAGIVVPQIKTAAEAEAVVRWALYPPEGERSVGISRAHGYGLSFTEYVKGANSRTVIVLQVEHREGVENIDSILAVPGVDVLLVGPYDLSGSLGLLGQVKNERVVKAIEKVKDSCIRADRPAGIFAADAVTARGYMEQGFRFIAVGMDTFFLWKEAGATLAALRPDE